jgi:hypothetical protein
MPPTYAGSPKTGIPKTRVNPTHDRRIAIQLFFGVPLPRLICFGEDFQARPAFEAGYIGIALDPNAAPLHWILAYRAERRIGTQRVVVFHDRVDFRKQKPAATI